MVMGRRGRRRRASDGEITETQPEPNVFIKLHYTHRQVLKGRKTSQRKSYLVIIL